MKKLWIVILIVALIATGVVIALATTKTDKSDFTKSPTSTTSDQPATNNNSAEKPVQQNTVSIKDYAYSPVAITVKVGTTVTWTNQDSVTHTVTADESSADAPSSGDLAQGDSYSFTFKKAGTYAYHCMMHPYMKGTVVVTE